MITIEEARTEHVQPIVKLWKALMDIHKEMDAEFFKDTDFWVEEYETTISETIELAFSDRKVFVALENEVVVGYATIYIERFAMVLYNSDPLFVIGDMMIEEQFRKQGIGELFIAEAKKMAKEFSVKKLMLHVFAKNQIAYQYFKQHGFEDMMCQMMMQVE
ncbi:GNAT family N-acetyltransferase [Flavobacterium aciduliphilum]|uniref:Acetyltransferase (GNAT) family protein n=1 Tax=Flavobacterium aciduliphilum TaxID=1101402 RepID=A0A328YUS2_9FLAO|nr:GNAT family N-acetyltransferase [Flavobacterium aciduliphilum]RAR73806.1 acetyltransferase (GNAT) family protein [Flavobacterium aciduliphilum]